MQISQETLDHLRENVIYPATGEQIIRADGMMSGISAAERLFNMEKINSRKTYFSDFDVLADLQASEDNTVTLYAGHAGPYVKFSLTPLTL